MGGKMCMRISLKKLDDAIYFPWAKVQSRITNIAFYGSEAHEIAKHVNFD